MTCRKAHAAAFNPFVVFDADQVEFEGEMRAWESSPGYRRWFCPTCGARVYGENDGEVEISAGSFDAPGEFTPEYESWTARREPWQAPLPVPQFDAERTP